MNWLSDLFDLIVSGIKWIIQGLGIFLIAIKTLILGLAVTILSLITKITSKICIEYASSKMSSLGIPDATSITFSDLAGYLISATKIDDCVYLILGAVLTRFILSFIPFR